MARGMVSLFRGRAAVLISVSLAAVGAVNLAGMWGIALSRKGAREEASRLFEAETEVRAHALEKLLGDTRENLSFLAASSPIARLLETSAHPGQESRWARDAAEGSLLLFLRGHPQVVRVALRAGDGRPLILMGRRGGIPVLWVAATPTGQEGVAIDPARPLLRTSVPVSAETPEGSSEGLRLEAEVVPSILLARDEVGERRCRLTSLDGRALAEQEAVRLDPGHAQGPSLSSTAAVAVDSWSVPGPWTLACAEPEAVAVSLVEPVAARYRTTLYLNLAGMALAVLLGAFVIREIGRRARLEAKAEDEVRVRDLERQLFHAERLTTVGRLAAGMAHEINNPLEGMSNYLTLARDSLGRGETAAAARRLEGVQKGLERVAGIVRQVLAHADPAKAPRTPVDLNQVVSETVDFVRTRKEFLGVRFGLDLAQGTLLALGSPIMLGQVAMNLVVNACEAQPGSGEVLVRSFREDGRIVVEIADRGPGVPEADRQRIFEPFFSTKDSTGLGLSVCHSIVGQHNGELSVRPREGGGAVFRMVLPAHQEGASR
jgi:signal transduction histidine kinase